MHYASAEDFVLRVGEVQAIELTDRDLTGQVNDNLLDVALSDSSSQIDGYSAMICGDTITFKRPFKILVVPLINSPSQI